MAFVRAPGIRSVTLLVGGALLTPCFLATPVAAQDLDGFQPAKGHGDVAFNVSIDSYDQFWVGENKIDSPPGLGEIETTSLSLWGRFGLTDRLALVATVPWIDVDSDGADGLEDSGLQDATVLVQYRLSSTTRGASRHTFAVGGGLRTPASDYEGNAPVSIGDDTSDALARFVYLYQRGRLYLSSQVGYDVRGGDAPDGGPLAVTLGWTAGRTTWSGTYFSYFASGGTDIGEPNFTFPSNEEEVERLGLKLYTRLGSGFGLSLAAFTTLDGRNTGDTDGYSIGGVWSY
jgi:hypothetical protein